MLNALRTAHSLGLKDAEIFFSSSSSLSMELSGPYLKSYFGKEEGIGIRVLKEGRLGFTYSNNPSKVGEFMKEAVKLSSFSPQTSFEFPLPYNPPSISAEDPNVVLDEALAKKLLDEIKAGIEENAKAQKLVVQLSIGEDAIANTNNLFLKRKKSAVFVYAESVKGDGSFSSYYLHYKILKDPLEFGRKIGENAKLMQHPSKPKEKKYVVLSTSLLSDILSFFLLSFSGDRVRRKNSILWDKKGEILFDEKLNVKEDPYADTISRSSFDDEGSLIEKKFFIKSGSVNEFYYDRYTSALANLDASGNCWRSSYSSPPSPGYSSVVVGDGNCNSIEDELNEFLYVEEAHGLHTANPLTGDFRLEVSSAFEVQKGMKKGVRGFMLVGNVFEMFKKIELIEKSAKVEGAYVVPLMAFDSIKIIS